MAGERLLTKLVYGVYRPGRGRRLGARADGDSRCRWLGLCVRCRGWYGTGARGTAAGCEQFYIHKL